MGRVIGKLMKSAMKRLPSFSKSNSSSRTRNDDVVLREVYVGKSRRRYLVSPEVVGHPLFRQLAAVGGDSDDAMWVADCEVVMFDHLLWMIHNAQILGPTHELVQFYTTSS